MLISKKHKLLVTRVVHFWTRIWSGPGDGLRFGSEACDDGNTVSGDGCKTPGPDGETSNTFSMSYNKAKLNCCTWMNYKIKMKGYFTVKLIQKLNS